MQGRIIKGISGFYYVYVAGTGVYECKAKGAFRKMGMKPLVGDRVEIAVIDEKKRTGNVETILPRTIELVRPAVSNIDMALVIFAAAKPDPNFNLLDRFLCMMESRNLPVTICFNKCDLIGDAEKSRLSEIYRAAGYELIFVSAKCGDNIAALQAALSGKTATVAGPSGVGKSSIINALQSEHHMETGDISAKIERGKNTTRHSQIIPINEDTFIMDTPGFSSLDAPGIEKEDLWRCYPEFLPYEPECRFIGCSHINEPDCGVKRALEEGHISRERYENYCQIYEEMKRLRKY
jgi:ribosome biogenesis GTPase